MARRSELPPLEIELVPPAAGPARRGGASSGRGKTAGQLSLIGAVIVAALAAAALLRPAPASRGPLPRSGLYVWTRNATGDVTQLDLDSGRVKRFGSTPLYERTSPAGRTVRTSLGNSGPRTVEWGDDDVVPVTERVAIHNFSGGKAVLADDQTKRPLIDATVVDAAGTVAVAKRCPLLCGFSAIDLTTLAERPLVGSLSVGKSRWPRLSPDGTKLALLSGVVQLTPTIYSTANGDVLWRSDRALEQAPSAPPYDWSPDGRRLVVALSGDRVIAVGSEGTTVIPLALDVREGIAVTAKRAPRAAPGTSALTVPTTTRPERLAVAPPLASNRHRLWAFNSDERLIRLTVATGDVEVFEIEAGFAIESGRDGVLILRESGAEMVDDRGERRRVEGARPWAVAIDRVTGTHWQTNGEGRWQRVDASGAVLAIPVGVREARPVPIEGDSARVLLVSHTGTDMLDLRTMQRTPLTRDFVSRAADGVGVIGSCTGPFSCETRVISLSTGETRTVGSASNGENALSPDGRWLAVSVPSGAASVAAMIEIATGTEVWRSPRPVVTGSWDFSPDASWFYVTESDSRVVAVDLRNRASIGAVAIPLRTSPTFGLAVTGG